MWIQEVEFATVKSIFSMLLSSDPGSVLLAIRGFIAKFVNSIVVVNKQSIKLISFTKRSVDGTFNRERCDANLAF